MATEPSSSDAATIRSATPPLATTELRGGTAILIDDSDSPQRSRPSTPSTPSGPSDAPPTPWQLGRPHRVAALLDFTSGPNVTIQDGLNGVRGLAVVPIVAFHLGYVNIVAGAQLAMSLFFTQSGFLIATLILHEYDRTGRFLLGPFWASRCRRIFPPAWMTLAAVGIIRLTTERVGVPNPMDVVTAFFHVSNWYLYASDAINDAIATGRASELNHFWSLSVEEQFYVFIALLSVVVVAKARRPAITLRWIAIVGALLSYSLPFVFGMNEERVFYGTDTRAGELLIGVAMATFLVSRDVRSRLLTWVWPVAAVAAAALSAAFVLWHYASPKANLLPRGLLPIGTGLFVLIILGAMMPDGPVAWFVRTRLLRWLGKLSYGIYAYHFPIISVVHNHLDVHPMVLTVIVVALTLSVAVISYRFVEIPIRRKQFTGRPLAVAAAAVVVTIAATTAAT